MSYTSILVPFEFWFLEDFPYIHPLQDLLDRVTTSRVTWRQRNWNQVSIWSLCRLILKMDSLGKEIHLLSLFSRWTHLEKKYIYLVSVSQLLLFIYLLFVTFVAAAVFNLLY